MVNDCAAGAAVVVEEEEGRRRIGDYVLGSRLGTGSFAVVWKATHRVSGHLFAIKQIDISKLYHHHHNNQSSNHHHVLLKEISILNTIQHPNIIRLFEVINTPQHIYLVMEFCDGGDLFAYIHRRSTPLSVPLARHFIRQLAAGLQVLNEKHLIHRDLKPQNLFLSKDDKDPILKIGDFGFARHLNSQGLAETVCGSPLYMAPEVIQNKKYDAKADLWSVGAILFQLVTGKPPFQGITQFELFQNILKSNGLRFPKGLDEDCADLCRSLLRNNPVERLSFQEFFNHKFLADHKLPVEPKQANYIPVGKWQVQSSADPRLSLVYDKRPQLQQEQHSISSNKNQSLHESCTPKDPGNMSSHESGHAGVETSSSVYDSMRLEEDFVIVSKAHFASMSFLSSSDETSWQKNSRVNVSLHLPKAKNPVIYIPQTKESSGSLKGHTSCDLEMPSASTVLQEMQGLSILHPSTRLQLLHQYVNILSEIVQEKWLRSFDQRLRESVDYAICLNSIGSLDNDLWLHVSKPPENAYIKQIFEGFTDVAEELGLKVNLKHKKINISNPRVAWEHEQFSRLRVTAATLSGLSAAPEMLENTGGLFVSRQSVNETSIIRGVKLVAESLARHIYGYQGKDIQIFADNSNLAVNPSYIKSWLDILSQTPRVAPFFTKNDPFVMALKKELSEHTIVSVQNEALDEMFTFYDSTKATLNIYQVASVTFDLLLLLVLGSYLIMLFSFLVITTKGLDDLISLFRRPPSRKVKTA